MRTLNKHLPLIAALCFVSASSMANLVAHLPLDNNANDITGNGHDGIVNGASLTEDRFGNPNSAFDFDGFNDYIDLGAIGGFRSVSLWVKQDSRNQFDFYFGHMDFRLYASTAENGRLTLGEASSHVTTPVQMNNLEDKWIHIVAISDGLQSKIYLNGVNVTIDSGDLKMVENMPVNLGRWPGPVPSARHYFNGAIDDVRIYDNALTEDEVVALYAIPEPGTLSLFALSSTCAWFFRRRFNR